MAFAAPVKGVRRNIFSAYEIERRPRGASRRKAAPTFVSGQLFLWDSRATPLGAWLDIASYKQGGRARLAQDGLALNKCGSGLASRCAARAALDLIGAEMVSANT